MNRTVRWGFALALLPLAACAGNPPPAAPAVPAAPAPLAAADSAFMVTAAQGDIVGLKEAQLAQIPSHSDNVLAFSSQMIIDHTKLDGQLKQLAGTKGVTLPTAPSDVDMRQIAALQSLKGRRFDVQYINDEVTNHQRLLQAYQTEAQGGTDPDVKAFAANAVPNIQSHLDRATALQKEVMTRRAARHRRTAR